MNLLRIRDFGPLKEVELELNRFMVITGPQSSGKSIILKLLTLFKDPDFLRIALSSKSKGATKIILDESLLRELLSMYNISSFLNDRAKIFFETNDYQVSIEGLEGVIQFRSKSFIKDTESLIREIRTVVEKYEDDDSQRRRRRLRTSVWQEIFEEYISSTYGSTIFIPAERLFFNLYTHNVFHLANVGTIPKNIAKFGENYQRARSAIGELSIPFLNINYQHVSGEDYVQVREGDSVIRVKLSEAASGFQAAIPMLAVLSENELSKQTKLFRRTPIEEIIAVEEPEIHLYPTAQKDMIQELVSRAKRSDSPMSSLLVTTHSPYVLMTYNLLVYADEVGKIDSRKTKKIIDEKFWIKKEDFAAYFLDKGKLVKITTDDESGLISKARLDEVSDVLEQEFYSLANIQIDAKSAKE